MPIQQETLHRRADDERITRIESTVNGISAKVNNGLTERSKQTAKDLTVLNEHINKHIIESTEMKHNINELTISVQKVVDMQERWINLFFKGLYLIGASLIALIFWIFINIDAIDAFFDHAKHYIIPQETSDVIHLPEDQEVKIHISPQQ